MTERDGYEHGVPCWVEHLAGRPRHGGDVLCRRVRLGRGEGHPARYGHAVLHVPAGRERRGRDRLAPAGRNAARLDHVRVGRRRRPVAASAVNAGGSLLAEPFGSLDGGRMAIVADPSGAVFGVWTPGAHRGAQRVNEPSAYSMSSCARRTPRAPRRSTVRCSAGRRRRSARCCCGASRLRGRGPRAAGVA